MPKSCELGSRPAGEKSNALIRNELRAIVPRAIQEDVHWLRLILSLSYGLEQSRKRLPDRRDIKPRPHLDSRSALGYIDD
jgi:hypothetical protein